MTPCGRELRSPKAKVKGCQDLVIFKEAFPLLDLFPLQEGFVRESLVHSKTRLDIWTNKGNNCRMWECGMKFSVSS